VEEVSRKPIPDHQRNLILEITADDQADPPEDDLELPFIQVKLK